MTEFFRIKSSHYLTTKAMLLSGIVSFFSFQYSFAQITNTEFVSVKTAMQTKSNKISIAGANDVKYLKKHLKQLPSIVGIRIDGNVNIQEISGLLGNMEDLEQVQLLNFRGMVPASFINYISQAEDIVFMIKPGNEDMLTKFPDLPLLNGATFWFTEVPDNMDFLESYQIFRKVGLVAPFVAKDLPGLFGKLNNFEKLEELTISVDRVTELPSLKSFPYLRKLTIIDNLGWLSNGGFTELDAKLFRLMTDSLHTIEVSYLSDGLELYEDEINHLIKCVGSAVYVPGASQTIASTIESGTETSGKRASLVLFEKDNLPQYLPSGPINAITRLETGVEIYPLDPDQNHVIYSPKGIRITIPSAEVKNSARTCGGSDLYLKLRAMKSTAEQTARAPSGYYYGGEKESYFLFSDKVFEITYGCKGEGASTPVAPHVFVDLITRSDSAIMAWKFHQNEWLSNSRYIASASIDDGPVIHIEPRQVNEIIQSSGSHIHFPMDTANLSERFRKEGYYFLTPSEQSSSYYTTKNGYYIATADKNAGTKGKEPVSVKRGKSLIQLSKAYVDRKTEPNIIKVLIADKSGFKLFPELKVFKNYAFVIEDTMSSRRFSQQYIYRKKINDVRIEYVGGNTATIFLKTEEGYIKLIASVDYVLGKRSGAGALKSFAKKHKKYETELAKRSLAFSQYQNKTYTNEVRNILQQFENAKAYEKQSAFLISEGMYSFASVSNIQDSFLLIPKFITTEGLPIDVKTIWVIYPSVKTARQFEEGNINLNPGLFSHIVCKDFDGELYLISKESLMGMQPQDGGLLYVPMTPVSEQVRNMKDWTKILSIKEK